MRYLLAVFLRSLLSLAVLAGTAGAMAGMLFVLNQPTDTQAGIDEDPQPLTQRLAADRKPGPVRVIAPLSAERKPVNNTPAPAAEPSEPGAPAIARPRPVRIETPARREWRDLLDEMARAEGRREWARVTAMSLNVRAAPGLMGEVKTQLPHGARVEVIEVRDGWSRIRSADGEDSGWVSSRYLEPAETSQPKRSAARTGDTLRK